MWYWLLNTRWIRRNAMELWRRRQVRVRRGPWNFLSAAAMTAWLALPLPALAQDNVVATATLPRDLSVWGMFTNANPVVQAVMIGLVFASVVTWTVWLAKSIEIFLAKRRLRLASDKLAPTIGNLLDALEGGAHAGEQIADGRGELEQFLDAAATELKSSSGLSDAEGIKERV